MNGVAWTDAAIEALIRSLDKEDWREPAADIHRSLLQWVIDGQITEERAERLTAAIQARHDRTADSARKKVEHRTKWDRQERRHVSTGGQVGQIAIAIAGQSRPAPPRRSWSAPTIRTVAKVPPAPAATAGKVGVRGPSRYAPEERAERAERRWEQVHLCGAPAGALKRLRAAACAVLAIIVFDCRQTANATCERSAARIAGAAAVSERAVQYAFKKLTGVGLIAIEKRDGNTHRITITSDEIERWRGRAQRFHSILLEEKIQKEEKEEAPPRGANACGTFDEEPSESPQDAPQEPLARVGAEMRPRPPAVSGANPMGIPDHGSVEPDKWAEWAALIPPLRPS